MGAEEVAVLTAGVETHESFDQELKNMIIEYIRAFPGDPLKIADCLMRGILMAANQVSSVGRTSMVVSLPRTAVPADMVNYGHAWKNALACLYVGPSSETTWYMPTIITLDGPVHSNISMRIYRNGEQPPE